jgi:uncharacterized repeat protein (TIGR02543 family)
MLGILWLSVLPLSAQAPKLLWTAEIGQRIQSSPAASKAGLIFLGADDGFLYALQPLDGAVAWSSRSDGAIVSSPISDEQNQVYFGSLDRLFYAVNNTGLSRWFTSLGAEIASSPALNTEGDLLTASTKGVLHCLNSNGNERWRFALTEPIISSPAIGMEGVIYFGGQDGNFYALRRDGTLLWQHNSGERINSSPAIAPDGTVYVANIAGKVLAFSPTGTLLWEKSFASPIRSSPVLTPDGKILIGTDDGKLLALKNNGDIAWSHLVTGTATSIRSTPAVAQDGTIYFGSYDGFLYALSNEGKLLWSAKTKDKISGSPLILANGTVIIGSWDGKVYAWAGKSGPDTNTWSMFRGNAQRTGRAVISAQAAELQLSLSPAATTLPAPANINLVAKVIGAVDAPSSMRLLVNGKQYGQLTAPPFGWTWTETNAGTYQLVAEATFPARAPLSSAIQTITLQPASMANDKVKPKLEIKAPGNNLRIEIPQIVLTGTAEDNWGLTRVEFQINGGSWQPASGTSNWTAVAALMAGENNILVRALDISGNYSAEEKRTFRRVVMAPLNVEIVGEGSVKPDLRKEELEVGNTYTLTAEPATGWVFSSWSGSQSATSAKLSFTMQTNQTLRAEFKPNPFKIIAGDFNGLIFQTNAVRPDYSGYFTLTTSARGAFKVRLQLGGRNHELNGQFDADGQASAVLLDEQNQALGIRFNLNWRETPDMITGSLFTERGAAEVLGDRQAFDGKEKRSPQAGNYTLSLSLPESVVAPIGNAYALVQVTEDGRILMKGRLGDGTPIEQTTYISPSGVWPFYATPHGNGSVLIGWLRFANEPFGDVHGRLNWIRPSNRGTNAASLGWQHTLSTMGSKYTPPARKQKLLNWPGGLLGVDSGGLPEMQVFQLIIQDNNDVSFPGLKPEVVNLKLAPDTGYFSGQFAYPGLNKLVPIEGVVLQKQNYGAGFFLTPNVAGRVFLGPSN